MVNDMLMNSLFAVLIGIGLAASCGFRVFVPMLVASVALRSSYLEPTQGFAWLSSGPAMAALALASVLEIAAYYVPWLDNLLDTLASPAAVVAGTVLFAAMVADFNPFLQWSLAIIAGGGSAAVVQGGTVVSRAASTSTTGGAANPVVSTLETLAGVVFSILSVVVPILAVVLLIGVVGGLYYAGRRILRRFFTRHPESTVD